MNYFFSQLRPIDVAFGGVIQDAYQHVSPTGHAKGFQSFLDRETKQRVYRGRYDDPVDFLKAVRSKQEQVITSASGEELNQALLPVIYYYRHLNYGLSDAANSPKTMGMHYYDTKGKHHIADAISLDISYRIVFMAYDSVTLDALVTAFLFHINTPTRINDDGTPLDCVCPIVKNGFSLTYKSGEAAVAAFRDRSLIQANHIPVNAEQGRLLVAEINDLPLSVPVLRSSLGDDLVVPVTVEFIREPNTHG